MVMDRLHAVKADHDSLRKEYVELCKELARVTGNTSASVGREPKGVAYTAARVFDPSAIVTWTGWSD